MPWRKQAYEVLPALSVRRRELRESLRISTIAWMYGVTWMVCTTGAHVNQFLRMLGFTNFDFGLMTALTFGATFGQPIAAILIERANLRKQQFLYSMTAHRLLWLAVAAIPFVLPMDTRWAVGAMLAIVFLSWFLNSLGQPAWLTWMGNLIPRRIRGRYFAMRMSVSRVVQIAVVFALSAGLDAVTRPKAPMTARDQPMLLHATCLVFALAAIFGAVDILLFRKIREVMPTGRGRPPVQLNFALPQNPSFFALGSYWARCVSAGAYQLLVEPVLKDRPFRRYVAYAATINFAMSVAGPFFMRNVLENLGFTLLAANVVYMVIGQISGLLFLRTWGRLTDTFGRRPVLMLATGMVVFSILPNFLAAPQTPSPQFLAGGLNWLSGHAGAILGHGGWQLCPPGAPLGAYLLIICSVLVGGVGWTGVGLAQTNIWLQFSDGEGRSKYVAASAVLMGMGGLLGGLVGGAVAQGLQYFQDHPIIWGPFLWNNWHATFGISCLMRLAAVFWLINMPDPGAGTFGGMMRFVGRTFSGDAVKFLTWPLRKLTRKGRRK